MPSQSAPRSAISRSVGNHLSALTQSAISQRRLPLHLLPSTSYVTTYQTRVFSTHLRKAFKIRIGPSRKVLKNEARLFRKALQKGQGLRKVDGSLDLIQRAGRELVRQKQAAAEGPERIGAITTQAAAMLLKISRNKSVATGVDGAVYLDKRPNRAKQQKSADPIVPLVERLRRMKKWEHVAPENRAAAQRESEVLDLILETNRTAKEAANKNTLAALDRIRGLMQRLKQPEQDDAATEELEQAESEKRPSSVQVSDDNSVKGPLIRKHAAMRLLIKQRAASLKGQSEMRLDVVNLNRAKKDSSRLEELPKVSDDQPPPVELSSSEGDAVTAQRISSRPLGAPGRLRKPPESTAGIDQELKELEPMLPTDSGVGIKRSSVAEVSEDDVDELPNDNALGHSASSVQSSNFAEMLEEPEVLPTDPAESVKGSNAAERSEDILEQLPNGTVAGSIALGTEFQHYSDFERNRRRWRILRKDPTLRRRDAMQRAHKERSADKFAMLTEAQKKEMAYEKAASVIEKLQQALMGPDVYGRQGNIASATDQMHRVQKFYAATLSPDQAKEWNKAFDSLWQVEAARQFIEETGAPLPPPEQTKQLQTASIPRNTRRSVPAMPKNSKHTNYAGLTDALSSFSTVQTSSKLGQSLLRGTKRTSANGPTDALSNFSPRHMTTVAYRKSRISSTARSGKRNTFHTSRSVGQQTPSDTKYPGPDVAPQENPTSPNLTHVGPSGSAHMVSISSKVSSSRSATAVSRVLFSNLGTHDLVASNLLKKGDVLSVARIAGIMAAKATPQLIPLCHPISLSHVSVDLQLLKPQPTSPGPEDGDDIDRLQSTSAKAGGVQIEARCECTGQTGVEMEALTAATVAGLTVYDMCKAVDKGMKLGPAMVVQKKGGKSGDWTVEGWKSLHELA